MKSLKVVLKIIGVCLIVYVGMFLFWVMSAMGCLQHNENSCGGDMLSQTIRVTHAPLVRLMSGAKK